MLKSFTYKPYDNYLIAAKNNKYGIINLKGESVIPFEYEYISTKSTLYFLAVKDGKYGAIDINNNVIVPFEYDSELILGKDFVIGGKYKCIVENDEVQSYILYGITDYNSNNLILFEYKELKPFGENKNIAEYSLSDLTFSVKKQNDKFIIVNGDNKQICEQEFEHITPESIKVYSARINGKDCAIDGKFLDTYANQYNKEKCADNRAEHDATNSCKTYEMKDGSKKQEQHYGFRAHIICDAKYGLPIKYYKITQLKLNLKHWNKQKRMNQQNKQKKQQKK